MLQLESLENRLVPSIVDGNILVATAPSAFSTLDQSAFPTGIIAIDPISGSQKIVAQSGLFSLPSYIAEDPNGILYITDLKAFGTGAVIKFDPNTGFQSLVATGGYINGPNAIVCTTDYLFVANGGDGSGAIHNLIRIDKNTGQQQLITDQPGFTVPTGMAIGPNNSVYIADEPGGFAGTKNGGVWQVNLDSGLQTQVTCGGLIIHPDDLATDLSGNIITVGQASKTSFFGSVVITSPNTGIQQQISKEGLLYGVDSVAIGFDIYVGSISHQDQPAELISVDPFSFQQSTVSTGGFLSLVEGIRIYHKPGSPFGALPSSRHQNAQTVTAAEVEITEIQEIPLVSVAKDDKIVTETINHMSVHKEVIDLLFETF